MEIMKLFRNIFLSLIATFAIISAVTYTSCSKHNKCLNVKCLNDGACNEGSCICPVGFEGTNCELFSRDKFISNYNGGDSCAVDTLAETRYPIHVTARIFNPKEFLIKNFLANQFDSAVATMTATDSFTMLGANNSVTYTGRGFLRKDTIQIYYNVAHDTISYNCHYVGLVY